MLVLVRVREYADPLDDLWPYVTGFRVLPTGCLLTLDVHDTREVVSVLVALATRNIEIEEVDTDAANRAQEDTEPRRDHADGVTSTGKAECHRES
jgi:hypothetical protein